MSSSNLDRDTHSSVLVTLVSNKWKAPEKVGLFESLSEMPNQELAGWGLIISGGTAFILAMSALLVIAFQR